MERKHYLDNIRWITVILVMIYHVIYIFNCQGVLSNFAVQGFPVLDSFLFFVYPWFMALLFVVAGASAKLSLRKRTGRQFLSDRVKRILLPSIFVMFALGWICGMITNYYTDIFGGNGDLIPQAVKALIYCLSGIGPMWFCHELFFACLVLLLVRAIDRKHFLDKICSNIKWWGFLLVGILFYFSAQICNTPMIEVYRNGIYTFSFLIGYYIFSRQEVLDHLAKARKILCSIALLANLGYVAYIWICITPYATSDILTSLNYCSMSVLKNPATNFVAYITILAIFSAAQNTLNFENRFSRYMTEANFGYFAFHYPCLAAVAFWSMEILHLPLAICYLVNFFGMIVLSTMLFQIVRRIPVLRALLLGIYKKK